MIKARVLIVEDELIVAEDLKLTLETLGYEVVGIAGTGEHAIELAQEKIPDLILMDIMLAGELDGVATADRIQGMLPVPVIYVTAYADDGLINRAKKTEPFGYIVKPFNEREVRSNIEIALYRHRMEQEIKKRDAILLALGSGVEWFMRVFVDGHTIGEKVPANVHRQMDYYPILEALGTAMGLFRIAVFRYDRTAASSLSLAGEWTAQGSASLMGLPVVERIDLARLGLADRLADIKKGRTVTLKTEDFGPSVRDTLAAYRFKSMAVLEIAAREEPYGLIFFVDSKDRAWPIGEHEAMRIATNLIGGAIGLSLKPEGTISRTGDP